jgi:hypothetical protein
MQEDFLHFLWRFRRFDHSNLTTTEGEPLEILHPGDYNSHAGADFSNARLKIGTTEWAGNVEMHLRASDWLQHRHQDDPAYGTVILHVVLEEDRPVLRQTGERIPCLEMKKRVPASLAGLYKKLLHNEYWIPCRHQFFSVAEVTKNLWLDRMLVDRLEQKTEAIRQALERNRNDWEETFYQVLARNFGMRVNAEPFEALARSLPQKILAKHRDNPLQIEALLFGQAGLLEGDFAGEDYPAKLKTEYVFLQKKYGLSPLSAVVWKFLRLHPGNFPTIRIAQFAGLVQRSVHLFSKVMEAETWADNERFFDVSLDGYWLTHYTFGKISPRKKKSLGQEAIRLIGINTIAPFLFVYGCMRGESLYKDKALQLLEELPPERNAIIAGWEKLGMEPKSAYQTQALLQLKNEYCQRKRCLHCAIGGAILR